VVHELVGHVPMLLDPAYGDMVHALGVASLGAPDAAVWRLTRVYWHTVEFGVVLEEGGGGGGAGTAGDRVPKAFGAGILSSPGELAHFAAGAAALAPLDPWQPLPRMAYKEGYQSTYFTLPSFAEGADMLRAYAAEVAPPEVRARFGLVGLGSGRLVPAGVPGAGAGASRVSSAVVPAPGMADAATPVEAGPAGATAAAGSGGDMGEEAAGARP
jgi:hypothetical protein